jgi:enamine deaminase RidA (YjgF/YER057c/UK114 family)
VSDRIHASSGSPFEATIGFSRAVRVGNRILVSGTAPVEDDGSTTPGDAGAQAERCLAIIVRAIEQLGGSAADVVRTRHYLVDASDAGAVGRAHGKLFGDVRPASTMVVVAGLLRPEWRVEIEAEAEVAA